MNTKERAREKGAPATERKKGCKAAAVMAVAAALILAACLMLVFLKDGKTVPEGGLRLPRLTDVRPPRQVQLRGYLAAAGETALVYSDKELTRAIELPRGTEVTYLEGDRGAARILWQGGAGYTLRENISGDRAGALKESVVYVRTPVNLLDGNGGLAPFLADKGSALTVTGCDYIDENGQVNMYAVTAGENAGYIPSQYVAFSKEEALAVYGEGGQYTVHAGRGDAYGGGDAAGLDYFPREKGSFEDNVMPETCRTLYIASWRVGAIDEYIALALSSGVNAFVVDITDGPSAGYPSPVMERYSPSTAAAAANTLEDYINAIKKAKDAGIYVIGRITTFNDSNFVADHPECAITDTGGAPLSLSGAFWPSPYDRYVWQYKADLAVEAVELVGFNEIQFDYVRFPDLTYRYEQEGTIDYQNTYGETKAQAIQRFLMYAADRLHDAGAYISADVFGESAYSYVTAYGQYWPAISNVVDAISGMPYPDHFAASGDWRPWEHPYETMLVWGKSAAARQSETPSPARVRTWIQAYDAIKEPYNEYGPEEIAAQIRGLYDAGLAGGYLTWNASSSLEKYGEIASALAS